MRKILTVIMIASLALLTACQAQPGPATTADGATIKVLAVENFLADISQNVAGERVKVESLIPAGLDPHAFEPAPADVAKIAECNVLIANGGGLEEWLANTLENAGGQRLVIEASAGLTSRQPSASESGPASAGGGQAHEIDPHFWLDPLNVVKYVENIRDGLSQADPAGKDDYTKNAAAYIAQLQELDGWITEQVGQIPVERRLIVTNHESFGYFADHYGFTIVGTILPSVSTLSSPSAQQLANLVDQIRASGVKAIFLETGANPQLAEQVAQETGVKVITDLYTHSLTPPGGVAPTYIEMMKYNVTTIVAALQ